MSRFFRAALLAGAAISVLAVADAHAQSSTSKPSGDQWRWTLGAGIAFVPDYEGSDDYGPAPFPLVRGQKGPYYGQLGPGRFGLQFESNFIPSENWRLGLLAAVRPGQRDVEDKRVDKIRSGGTTAFEMGPMGGYDFKFSGNQVLGVTLFTAFDVSGVHDGYQIVPAVEYRRPLGSKWSMRIDASGAYASGDYMSEYFGIDRKDAQRSGLDEYDADAAFKDLTVAATFGYSITNSWALKMNASYKRLLSDAEDSPVTDDRGDENQFGAGVSVSYTW